MKQWKQSREYPELPDKIRVAVEKGLRKQMHSSFYYRLRELNEKINTFTTMFTAKTPFFQENYIAKRRLKVAEGII